MITERISIVGAGLAGARAAQALRAGGFEGTIDLIGDEIHHPYDRPPLSKEILLDGHGPDRCALETIESWTDLDVDVQVGAAVRRLRPDEGALEFHDGRVFRTDKVLLCTGGRARRLHVEGNAEGCVAYLRTIEDALAIRDRIAHAGPVVVVGSGFIGSEVAAAAAQRGCDVTVIEADTAPFARVLGAQLGSALRDRHQDRGVRILAGTTVRSIVTTAEGVLVTTASGVSIPAALVVAGIGMVPATELAESAGIQVADGIVVDETCRTSLAAVWAAGDVANQVIPSLGKRMRLEHWRNAQDQGAAAARSMLGDQRPYDHVPWFWSDQYDVNLQVAGHAQPTDDLHIRGDAMGEAFAGYFLSGGVVSAVVGFNRPRDVRVGLRLIASRACPSPDQITDESFDLGSLL